MVLPLTILKGKAVENYAFTVFKFYVFELSFTIGLCTATEVIVIS